MKRFSLFRWQAGVSACIRTAGRALLSGALTLSFAACHSGSSSSDHDQPPATNPPAASAYLIGGVIAGLNAPGLVLQNNGGDDLAIDADATEFGFATKVAAGSGYQVTVLTQPVGLTCSVGQGSGANIAADIDTIQIHCGADTYTIAGSVTGLAAGGLVLQNNGADDLAVSANATSLQFATPIAHDGSYNITVLSQPAGLLCTVANGTGAHVAANVGNVHIVCSAETFPVGGAISGLSAGGLVLRNNGGDSLAVPVNATTFEFATPVAFGGGYNVTVQTQPTGLTCTVSQGSGSNVAAAIDDIDIDCSVAAFAVGGSISGLANSGLVLRNNGGDDLAVPANATSFQFATPVAHGGGYSATIQQQPAGLTCVVTNGSGSNVTANVAGIGISCSVNTYTIGGTVSGLVGSVVLQNNAGDALPLNADGSFTFATPIAEDGSYNVTVLTQPASQVCTVGNGSGLHVSTNIASVQINCATATFPIGGAISGLNASGLVLQNNGGDNLPVLSGATTFEFATPIAYSGAYNVTVLAQPTGLTCTVSDGSGLNVTATVNDIDIQCSVDTFDIGGSISGLIDSGLVLRNNGADDLAVTAGATSFQFATPVAYGGSYNATVQQQPTSQTCVVTNGSGTNVSSNVTNIALSCSTNVYTVGGTVSGLSGSVTLQNNGADDMVLNASGPFTFSTPVADGATYNVTVLTQPAGQTCSVTNGSGTMGGSNVTNVGVSCVASPTVNAVNSNIGDLFGDYAVTITGTNFIPGDTTVMFGSNPGYNVIVNSSTSLTVMVPGSMSLGSVDVTVTTSGGSATLSNGFTYVP
jgi:hypothetical protein